MYFSSKVFFGWVEFRHGPNLGMGRCPVSGNTSSSMERCAQCLHVPTINHSRIFSVPQPPRYFSPNLSKPLQPVDDTAQDTGRINQKVPL